MLEITKEYDVKAYHNGTLPGDALHDVSIKLCNMGIRDLKNNKPYMSSGRLLISIRASSNSACECRAVPAEHLRDDARKQREQGTDKVRPHKVNQATLFGLSLLLMQARTSTTLSELTGTTPRTPATAAGSVTQAMP